MLFLGGRVPIVPNHRDDLFPSYLTFNTSKSVSKQRTSCGIMYFAQSSYWDYSSRLKSGRSFQFHACNASRLPPSFCSHFCSLVHILGNKSGRNCCADSNSNPNGSAGRLAAFASLEDKLEGWPKACWFCFRVGVDSCFYRFYCYNRVRGPSRVGGNKQKASRRK